MSEYRTGERLDVTDRSLEVAYPKTSHIRDRRGPEVWSEPQTEGRLQERSHKCSHYNRSVFWFVKNVAIKLLKYNRNIKLLYHWFSIHCQGYSTGQAMPFSFIALFCENKFQVIVNWFIMDFSFWKRKLLCMYVDKRVVNVQLRLLILILIANL